MDCWTSILEDTKFYYFLLTEQFFDISTLNISQTVTQKYMSHTIFIFLFQDLQNSVLCLLTWIPFFYIKFANFWYITCSAPSLIPIWSRVYGLTWKTEYSKWNNIWLYANHNKSKYSSNTKGILKTAKKFFWKIYTK